MASAAAAKKWPRLSQGRASSASDQPQVGLVDQGGGLERLAGLLLRQPLRGEPAQLVVDQRQQLLGGLGVAPLDGGEDAGHVGHRRGHRRPTRWCPRQVRERRRSGEGSSGRGGRPGRLESQLIPRPSTEIAPGQTKVLTQETGWTVGVLGGAAGSWLSAMSRAER